MIVVTYFGRFLLQAMTRHAHSIAKLGLSDNPFDDNAAPLLAYNVQFGGKRWCKFDDLSGGESALANLALYFAIHR